MYASLFYLQYSNFFLVASISYYSLLYTSITLLSLHCYSFYYYYTYADLFITYIVQYFAIHNRLEILM